MGGTLKLVGAAFPRTGTMSVKSALESIGFGKCYHMHEVFLNPDHVSVWNQAICGQLPDWRNFLAGYSATLDTPACCFWNELAHAFPDARVLLLKRDPETWYESMYSTTYQMMMSSRGQMDPALQMIRRLFLEIRMAGRFEDRDFAVAAYRTYCNSVISSIPENRLLVYNVSQGWEPLCAFLGCDVPQHPFPMKNTRDDFMSRNNPA